MHPLVNLHFFFPKRWFKRCGDISPATIKRCWRSQTLLWISQLSSPTVDVLFTDRMWCNVICPVTLSLFIRNHNCLTPMTIGIGMQRIPSVNSIPRMSLSIGGGGTWIGTQMKKNAKMQRSVWKVSVHPSASLQHWMSSRRRIRRSRFWRTTSRSTPSLGSWRGNAPPHHNAPHHHLILGSLPMMHHHHKAPHHHLILGCIPILQTRPPHHRCILGCIPMLKFWTKQRHRLRIRGCMVSRRSFAMGKRCFKRVATGDQLLLRISFCYGKWRPIAPFVAMTRASTDWAQSVRCRVIATSRHVFTWPTSEAVQGQHRLGSDGVRMVLV